MALKITLLAIAFCIFMTTGLLALLQAVGTWKPRRARVINICLFYMIVIGFLLCLTERITP